jgi:hypothetical protein
MIDVPRGEYIGKRVGDPPKDEAEHFTNARRASVMKASARGLLRLAAFILGSASPALGGARVSSYRV